MPGLNSPNQFCKTRFQLALKEGCLETVLSCLDEIDCNEAIEQQTPLIIAILHEHETIVGVLLRAGADCNLADQDGNTPLITAIRFSNKHIVKQLLQAGADYNSLSSKKVTPLYEAADNLDESIVKVLLKKEARLQGKENMKIPEDVVDSLFNVISEYSSITHLYHKPSQLETLDRCKINALLSRNMYLNNLLNKATEISQPIFDELEEMNEFCPPALKYQPSIFSLNAYIGSITAVSQEVQKITDEIQHCYAQAEQLDSIQQLNTRLALLMRLLIRTVGAKRIESTLMSLNNSLNFFMPEQQTPPESIPVNLGFNALPR